MAFSLSSLINLSTPCAYWSRTALCLSNQSLNLTNCLKLTPFTKSTNQQNLWLSPITCKAGAEKIEVARPNITEDVTQLIGKTSMVYLNKIPKGSVANIAMKLEIMDSCCNVKDQIGNNMTVEAK